MSDCTCHEHGLRPGMTYQELRETLIIPNNYCTYHKHWMCPTLLKELIRADADRQRLSYYQKRKGDSGKVTVSKSRRSSHVIEAPEITFDDKPKRKVKPK